MTTKTADTATPPCDIEQFLETLRDLPKQERVANSLNAAARIVEFAAYETVAERSAEEIGRLIILAAQLQKEAAKAQT